MNTFKFAKTTQPKKKTSEGELGFGQYFTDHMFLLDYSESRGWHDGRIVPYGPLCLDPAASVLHYGQESFEGLKAYHGDRGSICLFRPDQNIDRINKSNQRLCIPQIDSQLMMDALTELVKVEQDWIPSAPGTSLYIRPFFLATEPFLGVRPANAYTFVIICSPVGSYYKEGLSPTKIYVEDQYVRAAAGGTGAVKTSGNYAASLLSYVQAHEKGYSQVLWLDAAEHKYVEEIGASNAFFVIDGQVITNPLTGTILPGITRNSAIQVLKDKGIPVSERRLSVKEIYDAYDEGKLDEVFATGTAAVISPVGALNWKEREIVIAEGRIGKISQMLYDTITGIQRGELPDSHGWITRI